ncbi:DUF2971 domain-containing protein [Escherichia coli]|uniref:DUF2971 domain-containing protein n=1 Tax=Escherichia coli TaxID=562 RepID=UPI001080C752|nr:DUF2971 domain-containing protein [Escherichia coli]EFB5170312.1 DUF2971 domain-containing protein [Escherichia coli]TGH05245.1 DUF2971 domain-containing protein [Escherichia coli]
MHEEDIKFISFLNNESPQNAHSRLYHYTTSAGFLGIFHKIPDGSPELWASEIRYMNDNLEFFHGISIIQKQADKLLQNESDRIKIDILTGIINRIHTLSGPIFITSFCEEDDLLSQWRGYGGETGYSIGWDFQQLKSASYTGNWMLARCIYDQEKQNEAAMSYLRYHITDWVDYRIKDNPGLEALSEFYFGFVLRRFIPLLKHQSFSEEKEWRLISPWPVESEGLSLDAFLDEKNFASAERLAMQSQHIFYRPGRSGIIPYVNFKVQNEHAIYPVSIRIGPNNFMEMSVQAMRLLLSSKGFPDTCKIDTSGSPFRI